jgi:hypothetical protein
MIVGKLVLNTVFWPGSVSGQSGRVGQGPNWERRLAGLRGKNRLAMLLNQMGKQPSDSVRNIIL